MSVRGRFDAKVDRSAGPDACWLWTGARDARGYGRLAVDGKNVHAHRVALILDGRSPGGGHACHTCDVKACVNPSHLYVGDARTNRLDAIARGQARFNPLRGDSHPQARLNSNAVRAIRTRYAAGGVRQIDLASEYGVVKMTISRAIRGETWADV